MRRLIVVFAVIAACWPVTAQALTVRDIVELSRAGLGEDVLLALIEVDPSVFPIDAATLKSLKTAGVSERVIVAMVRSARGIPVLADPLQTSDAPPQTSEPPVVVIDHHDPAPPVREVQEVQVAVPVFIPVVRSRHDGDRHDGDRHDSDRHDSDRHDGDRHDADRHDPPDHADRHGKPAEPVYWGFGGKLRPDAWQPK